MNQSIPDPARVEAFGQKMLAMVNQTGLALMVSIGHRVGLFDLLATMPPATCADIAQAGQYSERYVREWLGAMVTGGFVTYNPANGTFHLPAEHAACLTRQAAPNNLASMTQWVAVLGGVEDEIVSAFRHGKGVPYCAYHRFHEVMAEESEQTAVLALEQHILPLVPGLQEQLRQGATGLDVGCGAGRALLRMAELFPASRFTGYDLSEEAVKEANRLAKERKLANVKFEARDVAEMDHRDEFDLVTAFDAIHDQAKPDRVLTKVAQAVKPTGIFLMQDIAASSRLAGNLDHPLGPFLYTISCMHCMSVSLANGGPGLGATWGKELALTMLGDAGFDQVRVETLPHDPLNYYYVAGMSGAL